LFLRKYVNQNAEHQRFCRFNVLQKSLADGHNYAMKKVLLIDDDEVASFLLKRALQNAHLTDEVHTALNGREALGILNKNFMDSDSTPNVIILDLNMPVMNGFEFLEEFRRMEIPNKDAIKIVILTSSIDQRDIFRAKELGVDNFISKPISGDKLRNVLDF